MSKCSNDVGYVCHQAWVVEVAGAGGPNRGKSAELVDQSIRRLNGKIFVVSSPADFGKAAHDPRPVNAIFPIDTLRAVPTGFRRLLLWDYQRGVWQYDVICAIIVAFIFFSPPRWFRDQPRVPNVAEITSPTTHPGESAFYVGPDVVDAIPDEQRLVEIGKILTAQRPRKIAVTRIDPIYNSEQEVIGYMAYAKP